MLLKNLIKNSPKDIKNLNIKGLALNSKEIKKDFIFFAIKGNKFNGENYISEAIKKGACLIFCSKSCKFESDKSKFFKTNQVKKYLTQITSKFYSSKPKNIIAVTGTNGKTSVADFFYQILNKNKIPVAYIGTLGIKYKNKNIKTNLTSPDIITLHKNLEKLKKNQINNVIIEASSHGLEQRRLDNLKLKAGIFTNFSQDHLDYHKTMKAYLNAKLILFSKLLPKNSSIISDKSNPEHLILKKISEKRKLKLIDIDSFVHQINSFSTPLIGSFQIKNLSMAAQASRICGIKNKDIIKSLNQIKNVEGRLDLVKRYPNNVKVFIDYAHTPDALKEVILSIRKKYNDNISLVFGCGGDRDFKKRPLMAKIAKSYCKKIYVTDDNPRKENPRKIRNEIAKHLKGSSYFNIGNREKAIKKAILNADPNEIILIAGKGHENTQDYGDKIIHISDKEIIKRYKIRIKRTSTQKQKQLLNSKILNKILKNKKNYNFKDIAIDSREVRKGDLFIAIKGKNKDGNTFIPNALKKGASVVIASGKRKK